MKKISYIIVIIVFTIFLGAFIWNQKKQDPITPAEIYSLIEQGETKIDLTKLTNLEWTRIEVFGPYTTDEMIEDTTGIKFLGGIDVIETEFLLVFANENKAIKKVTLSRKYGDYTVKDNKFLIVE